MLGKVAFAVLVLTSGVLSENATTARIVCYYATWTYDDTGMGRYLPADLDPYLCTHLVYTFLLPAADGSVVPSDPGFDIDRDGIEDFVALKQINKDLITMIGIGGWNEGSTNFSLIVNDADLRANFVDNVVDFLETYDLDGLDFDWEYPCQRDGASDTDKSNFVVLIKQLKEAFEPKGLLLTVAVGATQELLEPSYDVPALNELVDFFNLMTYDLRVWDGVTGANAPLFPQPEDQRNTSLTVAACVVAWLDAGASPDKLNLGLGTYGHAYQLADVLVNGTGASIVDNTYAGPYAGDTSTWTYIEICSHQRNNTYDWKITNCNNSYAIGLYEDLWMGYDTVETMYVKGQYAKELDLGGIMYWSIDGDDFRGFCGERHALIKAGIRGYAD